EALAAAAAAWAEAPALAIDTEFERERTFYHRLGLVQGLDGRTGHLGDPPSVPDLGPVAAAFRSAAVKVLHSGSEDIEVFSHVLRAPPPPLFPTPTHAELA